VPSLDLKNSQRSKYFAFIGGNQRFNEPNEAHSKGSTKRSLIEGGSRIVSDMSLVQTDLPTI
jgi:hypothetical protein